MSNEVIKSFIDACLKTKSLGREASILLTLLGEIIIRLPEPKE